MGRLNQFLFRNRILFLYFLYIYICMYVLFRQEGKILITFHFERNSSFFSKNGTKFGRKKSFRLNSRLFVVEQKIRAKSIQLLSRASCSRLKLLEIGREFFLSKRGFTLTGQSKDSLRIIQIHPTFELCANNTLTLLSSFSNRSCCFLYLSASAKLLLLPCSLCRRPPRAFSRISCKSRNREEVNSL